jgi:NAD(P)-dependent dehydrogenase (short-subunit alcohol dehydrogenase family)
VFHLVELCSFSEEFDAVVVGASGGIGTAFADLLSDAPHCRRLFLTSRNQASFSYQRSERVALELTDESSIASAALKVSAKGSPRLVIVCTGHLHDDEGRRPEKALRDLDAQSLAHGFAVNTIGPALVIKHFAPLLPKEGKSVLAVLSARVGSISDNHTGGWYGYRAAKAALNQIVRTAAIEVQRQRKEAILVGLHPGTVDTSLSKPFQGAVRADALFSPRESAVRLLRVIDGLTPDQSGQLFAWDGARIPF